MSISMFDILGPITVGPSSSHTAGAVRLGLACRTILGEEVKKAKITFYGSFADTYRGHGTDKAVIGGLLGFNTDNVKFSPEKKGGTIPIPWPSRPAAKTPPSPCGELPSAADRSASRSSTAFPWRQPA